MTVLVPSDAAGETLMEQLHRFFTANELPDQFLRLRSKAEVHARLFAGKKSSRDDMGRMIATASQEKEKYGRFLSGVDSLQKSGLVDDVENYNKQREELLSNLMPEMSIVVTTPLNIAEMLRRDFTPTYIIFDDANLYRDTEIFHVLKEVPNTSHVLFVGDHRQLVPATFTTAGKKAWGVPAFERLVRKGYQQCFLNEQYRSHAALHQATSRVFYEGKLRSLKETSPHAQMFTNNAALEIKLGSKLWTVRSPVAFLNLGISAVTSTRDPTGSLANAAEANLALALAIDLIQRGINDVLIMSPYKAQASHIMKMLADQWPNGTQEPRIQTVDGSQGSEAEAVIITLAGNAGSAGFLRSPKRTNVMTSRARDFQFFIGSWDWAVNQEIRRDAREFQTILNDYKSRIPGFLVNA